MTTDATRHAQSELDASAPVRAQVFARLLSTQSKTWATLAHLTTTAPAVSLVGITAATAGLTAEALAARTGKTVLLVTAHLDDADETVAELTDRAVPAARIPALETLPGESQVSLELVAERLLTLRRIAAGEFDAGAVIATPIHAVMQPAPSTNAIDRCSKQLRAGDRHDPTALIHWLDDAGYERTETIEEPGDFSVRGGIIDIFAPGSIDDGDGAIRLDFFGDELESIREIDLDTMGSGRALPAAGLVGASVDELLDPADRCPLAAWLPDDVIVALLEPTEIIEQARGYYERSTAGGHLLGPPKAIKSLRASASCVVELTRLTPAPDAPRIELPAEPLPEFAGDAANAVDELRELADAADSAVILCQNEGEYSRTRELIAEYDLADRITAQRGYLHRGLIWRDDAGALAVVPNHELLGRFHARRRGGRLRAGRAMDAFLDL